MRTFSTALLCLVFGMAAAQQSLKKITSASASVAVGNKVFYAATGDSYGEELWVSNGTPEGTVMVKDINPGYNNGAPQNMVSFKGRLFFTGHTGQHGGELWTSDGTPEGTYMVTELNAGRDGSNPQSLVIFKDYLYFTTEQGGLYKSDGTAAGTILLEKIDYYRPRILAVGNNYLYYSIHESGMFRRTDGTTVTTVNHPLHDPDDGTSFGSLYAAGDQLYAFRTSSYQQKIKLFVYDEAHAQWPLLLSIVAPIYGNHELDNFITVGNKLFFSLRQDYEQKTPADELWVSDGTVSGTQKLTSFTWDPHLYASEMDHFAKYQDAVYFRSSKGGSHALWKSDGTPSGTMKVHDVIITRSNSYLQNRPVVSNGLLWFCGAMGEYGSGELWHTDGTPEGTKQYADLDPKGSGLPYLLTDAEGVVYFATGDSYKGTVLWNSSAAGEINVTTRYNSQLLSGETLFLNNLQTAIPCITVPLIIHNSGYKELALSNLLVTGAEFFVKGELPEFLEPNEKVTIDVSFIPFSAGKKTGEIVICSNDQNEPRFTIKLLGEIKASGEQKICETFDGKLVKSLNAVSSDKKITLSNTVINELLPSPTLVGTLSLPGFSEPVTFSLATGKGDEGNAHFFIDGTQLKASHAFDYAEKNIYAVRVRASTAESSIEEAFIIRISNGPTPIGSEPCDDVVENMNYGFTDTEFNSAGELFALTNDGRILRSSNEGVNWEFLNTGRWGRLSHIVFKGNTGYITGDFVLLKSDDNGATWFQLYLPFGMSYVNRITAYFLDEKKGFVAGGDGYLVYTEDGGNSWDIRNTESFDDIRNPWFWDENNGLAFRGGTILSKTTDGGRSWNTVNVGTSPQWTGMWFLNNKDGFIISAYNTYRTKDAGKTWIGIPNVAGEYFRGIEFKDEKNGYIYGGYYGSLLFVTNDGGESWTRASNPSGPGAIMGMARAKTGKLISVHSTDYNSYDGLGRSINFSVDEGSTWESLHSLPTEDFYKINFVTENVGYLLSEEGQYKTVDKGMTWKKFAWSKDIYSFHYFDENNALLSDGFIIYKTTDGGVTLEEVLVTTSSPDPYYVPAGQLYAVNDDVIFSYSDYALYRSLDGGDTWDLMTYDYGFYARDMQFISGTIGYRMELFGSIVKTEDGGTTWNELYTRDGQDSNPYTTLFFVDTNIGYKAGSKFSKTTDGGVTWNIIYTNFNGDVFDVYFTDAFHGYVATRQRYLYETFDGGTTWKEIPVGGSSSNGLYGIQYKHGNIYLVGQEGYFSQISNPGKAPTQPGYAVGPDIVCAGDSHIYYLSENYSGSYQWNISGGAVLNDVGTSAYVQFPLAGEYTMTINNVNHCGVSTSRIQTITAVALPAPELTGPEHIESLSLPALYEVTNLDENLLFAWDVTGAKSFTNDNSQQSTVMWELDADTPLVKVLVTDAVSGCRVLETLPVVVDVQLAVEEESSNIIMLYPNPTRAEVNIRLNENGPRLLKLYSSTGKAYWEKELGPGQEATLQLQYFPAGLYLIEISNGDGKKITKKIIKY
ncbi:YCF48-related protein [Chryseolinea sp. H1M3-3]|uniref:YCF48-related protein n=1 Tax=Chryseolinea sp. H1M3-3 TaxID=3034144 RepID=UPI0023EE20AD|nr:YCF48-related protein [Chryseolinea sp. H1M3-3]